MMNYKVIIGLIGITACFYACEPSSDNPEAFPQGPFPGLSFPVYDLEQSPHGLLAGTENGAFILVNDSWELIAGTGDYQIKALEAVVMDGDSILWLGTSTSLFIYASVSGEYIFSGLWDGSIAGIEMSNIVDIEAVPEVCTWVATSHGIFLHSDGQWYSADHENMPSEIPDDDFTVLAVNSEGKVFAGTSSEGAAVLNMEVDGISGASPFGQGTSMPAGRINDILLDSINNQWFAAENGLAFHQGDYLEVNWSVYSTKDGLCSKNIHALCRGDSGQLYASFAGELAVYRNSRWTCYPFNQQDDLEFINDMILFDNRIFLAGPKGIYFTQKP